MERSRADNVILNGQRFQKNLTDLGQASSAGGHQQQLQHAASVSEAGRYATWRANPGIVVGLDINRTVIDKRSSINDDELTRRRLQGEFRVTDVDLQHGYVIDSGRAKTINLQQDCG